jgi:hypothetical protein
MPLDRRAFLRLVTHGRERILEVSCQRLYVRWLDARPSLSPAAIAEAVSGWLEEPGEDELLAQLDACFAGASTVRLSGPEWLADADLRREVDARLVAFRQRGGRVTVAPAGSGA